MAARVRLSEAIDAYLIMRRARFAAATVDNEGFVLRRFAAWYAEDVFMVNVRPERVEEWFYGHDGLLVSHTTRDRRTRPPIQPSTANFYRNRLASFFRYCSQRGLIHLDLLVHVAPLRVVRRDRQQPTARVLLDMVEAAENGRDRAYLATANNTALRSNELTRLRVGDVDLAGGWLKVYISKSAQEDHLPITSDLDAELRTWLTAYSARLSAPLSPDCYLFPARKASVYEYSCRPDGTYVKGRTEPSWDPAKPVTKTERLVQHALRAVGLDTVHEGTHTVRRAVARNLFDRIVGDPHQGYDGALRIVSAVLHHKSTATTEGYLGLKAERLKRDDILRGQPFLSAMVAENTNVINLREAGSAK